MEGTPDPSLFRTIIRIRGYYPAHPDLFTLREFADAIGASPKVIRAVECAGMIKSEHLPGQKARKLFFKLAAIRLFLKSYYLYWVPERSRSQSLRELFPDEWCSALRSVKIALNPNFVRGNAVTIDMAMARLAMKRRTVQYYLQRGVLKKIPCGLRTILVTRGSLERLYRRRARKS
jgi:hypothetical protein